METVLIIEDNPNIANLEKRYLERDGFTVLTAESGEEGLGLIGDDVHPDILIIDYRLPDMSGVDLMQRLKDKDLEIPSIIVTAAGNEQVAVSAMKLGAMDYIVKDSETIKHLPDTCRDILKKINLENENKKLVDELKEVNTELREANTRLDELSKKDDLTGVFNRRYLIESLTYETSRCRRYKTPLSFAMFDLDHFKDVNDTYGHTTGDYVLKQFASVMKKRTRKTDILGRYGGEEFAIVLTETELASAIIFCEEIKELVSHFEFGFEHSPITMTTSAGIASFTDQMELNDLIDMADKGLYKAKEAGRNRIVSVQKES
jgi:diguanylate cyclase (GGDEF)-like protein